MQTHEFSGYATVGDLVSSVRWIPSVYANDGGRFLTGSHERSGVRNFVSFCKAVAHRSSPQSNTVSLWRLAGSSSQTPEPRRQVYLEVGADVTDIELLTSHRFLFSTGDGIVRLAQITERDTIEVSLELPLVRAQHNYGVNRKG